MTTSKKMAALLVTDTTTTPSHDSKTKLETILHLFVRGISLNRFDAEHHHDHCLHSTVSTLQNQHLITIASEYERVPCLGGAGTVRVKRYWLDATPINMRPRRELLEWMRGKRAKAAL